MDTFVTQGNFDQSTGTLNQDGSVSLTSDGGGTDLLINIENVQFDNELVQVNDTINNASLTYEVSINNPVNIIAVSKTFPITHIQPLLDYGHLHFGENKVQEAISKWSFIKKNMKM